MGNQKKDGAEKNSAIETLCNAFKALQFTNMAFVINAKKKSDKIALLFALFYADIFAPRSAKAQDLSDVRAMYFGAKLLASKEDGALNIESISLMLNKASKARTAPKLANLDSFSKLSNIELDMVLAAVTLDAEKAYKADPVWAMNPDGLLGPISEEKSVMVRFTYPNGAVRTYEVVPRPLDSLFANFILDGDGNVIASGIRKDEIWEIVK